MINKILSKLNFLKPKGVGYNKFLAFSQSLDHDASEIDTISAVILHFYPNDKRSLTACLEEFCKRTTRQVKYWLDLKLDFENQPASYFIKADFLCSNLMLVELYNHLANDKKEDIPTQMATQVRDKFLKSVEHFKEKYEWIYNPPATPSGMKKVTIGSQYRKEFQEHYGSYAEITYLISGGDSLKFEDVEKMRLENYLSFGEYLLRKNIVENIE